MLAIIRFSATMVASLTAELSLFTAGVLIRQIRNTFDRLFDVGKGDHNHIINIVTTTLSTVAVFFTQRQSFLDDQVQMQKERGRSKAASLFGVHRIPCDQQIRNLLDPPPRRNSRRC